MGEFKYSEDIGVHEGLERMISNLQEINNEIVERLDEEERERFIAFNRSIVSSLFSLFSVEQILFLSLEPATLYDRHLTITASWYHLALEFSEGKNLKSYHYVITIYSNILFFLFALLNTGEYREYLLKLKKANEAANVSQPQR